MEILLILLVIILLKGDISQILCLHVHKKLKNVFEIPSPLEEKSHFVFGKYECH